jgi:hypothetical protein
VEVCGILQWLGDVDSDSGSLDFLSLETC